MLGLIIYTNQSIIRIFTWSWQLDEVDVGEPSQLHLGVSMEVTDPINLK